ncbi:spexin isoform X1 [Phyllostomus discolor]|uniref:Spexin isoform X1 n=1 Tax=Phyllostomus discolor TaxID=89673 RepID=A0A7E6D7C6_9CHIR|nr:spexin isoform X1 [Phyllostomus discolor]
MEPSSGPFWLSRGLRPERPKPGSPVPAAVSQLPGAEAARREAAAVYLGSSGDWRALSRMCRLCRGAPLHLLRPESEEGPLGPAAAGKAKSKWPTSNSSRGSSSAVGFLAEATKS